ncbi:MAG: hypothetical protein IEMM0008_0601 [bacterium]|nr:MAG: hypothetical protein IEMM0008_0601 [bacterium]
MQTTTIEELKEALFKLPTDKLVQLNKEIHSHLESLMMMKASETAFSEWLDPDEDIYNDLS